VQRTLGSSFRQHLGAEKIIFPSVAKGKSSFKLDHVPPTFHLFHFLDSGPVLRRCAIPQAAAIRRARLPYFLKFCAGLKPMFSEPLSGMVKSLFVIAQAKESSL
jgi:hypothetical protein